MNDLDSLLRCIADTAGNEIEPGALAAVRDEFQRRLATLTDLAAPGFAAHIAAPPHPAAILGYVAALVRNPNNHDRRHAAATLAMEREAVAELARMLGLPATAGGHLGSGGSAANLDGIWHCRQRRPGAAVAFTADAHFIHRRICRLMGVEAVLLRGDADGRVDLADLERQLAGGRIGTVVLSAGTPGLGAVDPIAGVVELRRRHDFSIHVDASYGGFFALLRDDPLLLPVAADLAAIADCDSVAIDPHKHGYQPYGCGCVLFRDGPGRGYDDDSPYTDAAASGFECSRPGAAAAALWLTLRCLPLSADAGLGTILRDCLAAARRLAGLLAADDGPLALYRPPQLGIVACRPRGDDAAAISAASRRIQAAAARIGVEVGLLRLAAGHLPGGAAGEILRIVLMKRGQLDYVPQLLATLRDAGAA